MKILIYCDYAYNFGDLSFGKKTADALKKHYPDAKIHIITTSTPVNEFKRDSLFKHVDKINEHATMPITYLDIYQSEVDVNDSQVDLLVLGPVLNFSPSIVNELTNYDSNVPIIVMGEYDFGEEEVNSFKRTLSENEYTHVVGIPTGINIQMGSKGIYLSAEILAVNQSNFQEKKHIFENELPKTKDTLLNGRDIESYAMDTEVAVNYSHNNAKRVIGVHSMYVDPSDQKNVDLIMLGEDEKLDLLVLTDCTSRLLDKGFSQVIYQSLGDKPIVLGQSEHDGPTYRVIHTGMVSPQESLGLRKIAGDFSGATGDQSLSEALSGSRIVIYETESHKMNVANGLENIADEVDSTNFLRRVIHLLNHATTEEEFSELAVALKKPKTQAMLTDYHQAIKERNLYNILPTVVDALAHKASKREAYSRYQAEANSIYKSLENGMSTFLSGVSSKFKDQYKLLIGRRSTDYLKKNHGKDSMLKDTDTDSEHSDDIQEPPKPKSS